MIKIKNLSKKYNNQYVLKKINLILPSKWLIGISREFESGKSNFMLSIFIVGKIILNYKEEL